MALIGPLLTIPIVLSRFGDAVFGLTAAVGAFIAAAVFADFGLGSGLLTRLTDSVAADDQQKSRDLVVTGLVATGGVGLLLALAVAVPLMLLDPGAIFPSAAEAGISSDTVRMVFGVSAGAFLLNLPLSLVHRCQLAFQMLVSSNVWMAATAVIQVFVTISVLSMGATLGVYLICSSLVLPVMNLVNWLWFVLRAQRSWRIWAGRYVQRLVRPLLSLGVVFMILNFLMAASLSIDPFLVASFGQLTDSAALSIAWKMAALLSIVVAAITMSYWPTAGAAAQQGDYAWLVRNTPKVASSALLAATGIAVVLWLLAPLLLSVWLPDSSNLAIPAMLILGACAWYSIQAFVAPFLAVLSSQGIVWVQSAAFLGYLAVAIPLKIWLLKEVGLTAVPWIGTLIFGLFFVPLAWGTLRWLRRQESLGHVAELADSA